MFTTNLFDPESPISQSIAGIIVKAFNEYMTKQIPMVISDTLKTFPQLNDLRHEGTINRSNANTSVHQLHEHISKMETSGHPNLSFTLLSLNDYIKTFQHSLDRTYFPFMKNYLENS